MQTEIITGRTSMTSSVDWTAHLEFVAESFDRILCGLAFSETAKLPGAVSEFHRVLKSDGRLTIATWVNDDKDWDWFTEQCDQYGIPLRPADRIHIGLDEIHSMLTRKNFTSIRVHTEESTWTCTSEEEWWTAMRIVSHAEGFQRLEPTTLEQFREEAFRKMQLLRKMDGFHRRLRVNYATGVKSNWSD